MELQELEVLVLAWLLTYALHSTVLLSAACLLAGRLWKGSERASELVWKAALIGGLVTASAQQLVAVEPLGGQFLLATPEQATARPQARPAAPQAGPVDALTSAAPARTQAPRLELSDLSTTQLIDMAGRLEQRAARPSAAPVLESGPAQSALGATLTRRWTSLALLGWGLGGGLFLMLTLLAWRRLRDHLAGRVRLREGPLVEDLARLRARAGLRRRVRLSSSERLTAPIATGVLFPHICVPARSLRELDRDERRGMLAHELAHIVRLDPLWLTLGQLIQTLLFFQPLNRLARKRIEYSAEMLCDAQAVEWTGERVPLARCLAKVAGWVVSGRRELPACAMAHLHSPLGARVQGILQGDARVRRAGVWAWPSTAIFVAGTWMVAPGFAGPQLIRVAPPTAALLEAERAAARTHRPRALEATRTPLASELVARRAASAPALRAQAESSPAPSSEARAGGEPAGAPMPVLGRLLAEQGADMGELEREIADLRQRMRAGGASEAAWQRLREIEDRLRRVRDLGSRVHDILETLTSQRASETRFTPLMGDDR